MSDRWYIHQEGQALGPYTAADIREQLREGRIDPFDLVSRDGSSVRRELVEVDEIFATSKVVYADPAPFDGNTMELDSQKMVDEIVASEERLPGGVMSREEEERQAARNAKTLPPGSVKKHKKARRDPKQYHLVDGKGRNLGPLSAGDIQQLYFKGRLDKHVKVVKSGSAAQVPIDKFVQVFAKSGAQRLPAPSGTGRQASAPASAQQRIQSVQPSAPRMPNLRQRAAIQHHLVIGLLVVLGVALLGFAGWIFQQRGGFDLIGKKFSALSHTIEELAKGTRYDEEEAPKPRPKKKPRKVKPVEGKGKLPRGRVAKVEADEEDEEPAPKTRKVRKKKGEPRERDRVRGRERDRERDRERKRSDVTEVERRKKFAQEQKRLQLAKAQDQQRARRTASAVSKVGYVPKAAPQAPRTPVAAPAPPKASGPTVGGLQNGQSVSGLGPMRYDKNAVAACEGACVVSFSGAGGTVTGRFFKGAFGDTLMAKGGSVYISGLVRKNGASVTILINGVN